MEKSLLVTNHFDEYFVALRTSTDLLPEEIRKDQVLMDEIRRLSRLAREALYALAHL